MLSQLQSSIDQLNEVLATAQSVMMHILSQTGELANQEDARREREDTVALEQQRAAIMARPMLVRSHRIRQMRAHGEEGVGEQGDPTGMGRIPLEAKSPIPPDEVDPTFDPLAPEPPLTLEREQPHAPVPRAPSDLQVAFSTIRDSSTKVSKELTKMQEKVPTLLREIRRLKTASENHHIGLD